ncbi:glycoside hydrolase family 15 protein [Roridomyces roridus]|uniref:Glucoamylase n=1 Tax=Roridomyces roridus TaxID=1738132 RepID=A0AAD7C293_9AGAR|nr:glycoside hydrolase family 15 protein [Roridomyces roridus]
MTDAYTQAMWSFACNQLQALSQTRMRVVLVSALSLCSTVLSPSLVDSYIAIEAPIAKAGILANIGPNGAYASAAAPGVVIASPSTHDPDYLYTWVRDASLVFKLLIDQYTTGQDPNLGQHIQDFIQSQTKLQQVSNPSGSVSTGGLGEPKFQVNETDFTGSWGRPQRDGPALRSTALITYANWSLNKTGASNVLKTLWPIIKLDLDYVAANWNQTGFDLWEEVDSSSFFTTAVQHRALRQGAALAAALGQDASTYAAQADNAFCFLQSYWNGHYMTANTGGDRSGIDSNTVLASIHTFDPAAGCDANTFQPCSDKALSNLKVYLDAFRSLYRTAPDATVPTGRYPEDEYMTAIGGTANPWYLCTAAVAEQLYGALIVWKKQSSLEVTDTSLAFFQQFDDSVKVGNYTTADETYGQLVGAIRLFAEDTLAVHANYTPANGALSEQFNRTTGAGVSAANLTWSYAAVLTAFSARAGNAPESWGAAGLKVPRVCKLQSGPMSSVTFTVNAETTFGESIYLTGSVVALEVWNPTTALPMSAADYPIWTLTVQVPASTDIQYKYIRKFGSSVIWESDPNNQFTSPAGGETVTLEDSWR